MFFRKIDISVQDEDSLLIILATNKNKCVGKINCIKEKEIVTIGDIQCNKNNRGYGSLMMKALITYAKQNDIKFIEGWISEVDDNHIERLYHFYKKFGFDIIPCKDGMKIADIKLML